MASGISDAISVEIIAVEPQVMPRYVERRNDCSALSRFAQEYG
jgi:hypothetical protein